MSGILVAYMVIRVEIENAAAEAGLPPTGIRFIMPLHLTEEEFL